MNTDSPETVRKPEKTVVPENVDPEQNDTASYALYMNCVKQHGWMRGLGKRITDEHASHLPSYYRFSKKNRAGHWTKVENLNGYGQLENGKMGTYIVNPFDDEDINIDLKWKGKLKQVVCVEFVGDLTGENCIQENAYDKYHNLIYSFIPVQIAPDKYMGHYVDAWGMPAEFRDKKGAKYVVVQMDEKGYETEVSFIGDDGFPKKNMWDAYISKYTYDKLGNKIEDQSCTVDGLPMRDRSDNCGQRQTTDEYGNSITVTNRDENGEATRVNRDDDYIQYKCEYDRFGREIRRTYRLADGSPDTTRYGIHGYIAEYNDYGQATFFQNIGLDNKPVNYRPGAFSSVKRDYNKAGDQILFELRDCDNLFCNNADSVCICTYKYVGGQPVEEKWYKTTNGTDTILTYHFYRDGNKRICIYPERNEIDVYTDNDSGITIEEQYYTLDWEPRTNYLRGYHRYVLDINNEPGKNITEGAYYDTENRYVSLTDDVFREYLRSSDSNLCNRYITINDTANAVMTRKLYDGQKIILQFQQPRTADYMWRMGEIGIDIMGEKARTHYEQALYYNAYTGNTIKGDIAFIGIINEYGETAYAQETDWVFAKAYAFRSINGDKDLDENGKPIDDSNDFIRSLPRAYVIEVCDSCAADMGIKSGDIIMKYGGWKYPEPTNIIWDGNDLREKMFLYHNVDKNMTVMRRNPETNTAEAITIPLGKGMPRDYGFYIYSIPYTEKETERYSECYKSMAYNDVPEFKETSRKTSAVSFFRPLRLEGHEKNVFGQGVEDDAILLGTVVQDTTGVCHSTIGKHGKDSINDFWYSKNANVKKIWFTTDLRTVQTLEIRDPQKYWDAVPWTDDRADHSLSKICSKLQKETDQQMKLYSRKLEQDYVDSLISKYGDAYRAVENDSIIIIVGSINEEADNPGYMVEQGFKGKFVILEWCGWKCTDTYAEYRNIFDKNKKKKKQLLLLPIVIADGRVNLGDIVEVQSTKPTLGLTITPGQFSFSFFKSMILPRYKAWKDSHQQ